jgi:ADP-ribosyl-[dinitrogen reductase] hydrolase
MALARTDAELTHPNPVCQDVNAIFATTIAFALKSGEDNHSVYRFAVDLAFRHDVSEVVRKRLIAAGDCVPTEFEGGLAGSVLVAFQNAFYQLLHARSVREGIISTVRFGGDTDTNAAIAGALLGAVYGREAIPKQWINQIQSCRPIAGSAGVIHPRSAIYWPVDASTLAENLLLIDRAI